MDYARAYIKLYGACGAAMEEIERQNYGRSKDILQKAISAAEEITLSQGEDE